MRAIQLISTTTNSVSSIQLTTSITDLFSAILTTVKVFINSPKNLLCVETNVEKKLGNELDRDH